MEPAQVPAIQKLAKITAPLPLPLATGLDMNRIYTDQFAHPSLVPSGAGYNHKKCNPATIFLGYAAEGKASRTYNRLHELSSGVKIPPQGVVKAVCFAGQAKQRAIALGSVYVSMSEGKGNAAAPQPLDGVHNPNYPGIEVDDNITDDDKGADDVDVDAGNGAVDAKD